MHLMYNSLQIGRFGRGEFAAVTAEQAGQARAREVLGKDLLRVLLVARAPAHHDRSRAAASRTAS